MEQINKLNLRDIERFPLVSVRIPAYNHAKFIRRCLESVIADTYPNKELVVLDDGSQDDTFAIISRWAAEHKDTLPIRVFRQANKGICKTLNSLVDRCQGKYLVSLASDDMLVPGGIGLRVQFLESHPSKLAVIGDCTVIDADDRVVHRSALEDFFRVDKKNYLTDEGIKGQVVGYWAVPGPALMVRKELYDKIGKYDERFPIEDWHLYLRMVEKDLLGFIPEIVSCYRLHGENQSQQTRKIECLWGQIEVAYSRMPFFSFRYKLMLIRRIILCLLAMLKARIMTLIAFCTVGGHSLG